MKGSSNKKLDFSVNCEKCHEKSVYQSNASSSQILKFSFLSFGCFICFGCLLQGWDRGGKHQLPTLSRRGDWEAWGMTVTCGDSGEHGARWSGIAAHRNAT